MHTHTNNTCQPEPQLKSFSCSSAILSHNSRDVISSHNSRNATCLTPIPSHNSRDTFRAITQGTSTSRPSRYHRSLVDHAPQCKKKHNSTVAISPDATLEVLGEPCFQAAWQGTCAARRQAPLMLLICRLYLAKPSSPPGATLSRAHCFYCCSLAVNHHCQAPHQYLWSTGLSSNSGTIRTITLPCHSFRVP